MTVIKTETTENEDITPKAAFSLVLKTDDLFIRNLSQFGELFIKSKYKLIFKILYIYILAEKGIKIKMLNA